MPYESDSHEDQLFSSLVLNFQVSAMIGLGKIVNPVTQKAARNLDEAKIAIDMLDMLANKTKGNLADDENRMLQQILTDLRLNFINEKSQAESGKEQAESAEADAQEKQASSKVKETKKKKKAKSKKKK